VGIPRNWKREVPVVAVLHQPVRSPFVGIPRNWKHVEVGPQRDPEVTVPPLWGALEIGNPDGGRFNPVVTSLSSPFVGSPRNWKLVGIGLATIW